VSFALILLIWTGLHVYVLSRLLTIPFIAQHIPPSVLIPVVLFLGASYILARVMEHFRVGGASHVLEYVGANWIGAFFLIFASFLFVDVFTGFGLLFRTWIPMLRGYALFVAGGLILISVIQASREPAVTEYEVGMPGLPRSADGTVMVVASDMHLGSMLDHRWAKSRTAQFDNLNPDVILLVGDIFEGDETTHAQWLPVLKTIRARHGVFMVTGNHEFYAGPEKIVELFRQAGAQVLRDESAEPLPGLVIAGVDDVAFRGKAAHAAAVDKTLNKRPAGATVFLSHTPVQAQRAAQAGANLMLSGHTHEGQIWPFQYLVRTVFPLVAGRYEVDGMTVIVGRGTGTWGPRMRLWKRSELLKITLKARSE
jgi:uncharacterized protein